MTARVTRPFRPSWAVGVQLAEPVEHREERKLVETLCTDSVNTSEPCDAPVMETRRRAVWGTLTHTKSVKLMRMSPLARERIAVFRSAAKMVQASEHLGSFALDTLAASGDARSAQRFFDEIVHSPYDVRPTALSYCILLKAYGRAGDRARRMSNVELRSTRRGLDAVVKDMQAVAPDVVLVNALIDAYVRCDAVDKAVGLLDLICLGNSKVSTRLAVLSAFNSSDGVPSILKNHVAALSPNARTFNAVLKGLARRGDVVGAFALTERMKEAGIEPTVVTEGSLVHALAVAGKVRVARCRLRRTTIVAQGTEGAAASTAAYTALVRHAESPEEAFRLVNEMRNFGVRRNAHTYAELLVACTAPCTEEMTRVESDNSSRLDLQGTRRILPGAYNNPATRSLEPPGVRRERVVTAAWRLMLTDNVTPTDVCYNAAIRAYLKVDAPTELCVRRAFSLFSELMKARRKERHSRFESNLYASTLNNLIDGLVQSRDFEDLALALFSTATAPNRGASTEKKPDLPAPNLMTYSIALRTLGRRRDAHRVRATWKAMRERFEVDLVAFNTYLDALVRCDDCETAVAVLETAKGRGAETDVHVDPDVVSYSTVVHALAGASRNRYASRRALRLYDEFRKVGRHISYESYDRHLCCQGHTPDLGLVRAALGACAGLQAAREDPLFEDGAVRAAKRVLNDAKAALSPADYDRARDYARDILGGPSFSETWKGDRDDLLKKKRWNAFDSGFRLL
eukprot:CAMPEP_0118899092 /NCGR_PEP_ID=MMETSP1166-20130328/5797_1 /TAXON_ID=1104430 /ORGANISM="Chrysoreinhardia sp, Strain CCMP3193" /LENGTH=741 /DNA_ID=CAMNT_0006838213 /DNA_START=162 /DNA_END=2387 /DNA_ORIENTATION=-